MRLLAASIILAASAARLLADAKQVGTGNQIEIARQNFQTGNLAAANAALDRFEKENKPTVESLDLRGSLLMEQRNFEAAAKAFDAAHVADPANFAPRIHMGDLLFRQKKFAEARGVYENLLKETNILTSNERLRFGILLTYLAERDDKRAQEALNRIPFPTQTPAYYYAQAAWAFAHGKNSEARRWIGTADRIFPAKGDSWFARPLYELGWLKEKPSPALNQSI
jgi:tetratricopeptide (TPR) repeat protein